MVWGHGSGLIAILIEEVGLGSDDGGSLNKTGATSPDQSLFTNPSQIFAPAHDQRHDPARVPR